MSYQTPHQPSGNQQQPDGQLHEACGVVGVYSKGEDVARYAFFGIYALQHRGQESAGIASADGESIQISTQMGLVGQAFNEDDLRKRSRWKSSRGSLGSA